SHTAFMNLYRAAEALSIWVNEETQVAADDSTTREIRPGDAREDGWREYTQARSRGERLSDEFVSSRWEVNHTALELGLVSGTPPFTDCVRPSHEPAAADECVSGGRFCLASGQCRIHQVSVGATGVRRLCSDLRYFSISAEAAAASISRPSRKSSIWS